MLFQDGGPILSHSSEHKFPNEQCHEQDLILGTKHVPRHEYVCAHTHIQTYIYIYTYTYVYMYICLEIHFSEEYVHRRSCIHTYVYACMSHKFTSRFEHSIILVAISSIKWSHPGTLLNHFFRHYKMENRMFGVVLEWFIRICFIYFLFGQVLLYRGHLGSYCKKAVHLVGVAQASTL